MVGLRPLHQAEFVTSSIEATVGDALCRAATAGQARIAARFSEAWDATASSHHSSSFVGVFDSEEANNRKRFPVTSLSSNSCPRGCHFPIDPLTCLAQSPFLRSRISTSL